MRNLIRTGIAAVCLLSALGGAAHAGGIAWAKSLDVAISQAKLTKKLVMIDFYTDWCTWCKKLDADVYTDDKVVQASNQVIPVKVNAEKEGVEAAKKYHVGGYPTILFINSAGEVEGKIGGYEKASDFAGHVNGFVAFHKEVKALPALEAKFKAHPEAAAASKLITFYTTLDREEKADATLSSLRALDPADSKGFLTKAALNVADMYQTAENYPKAIDLFRASLKTAATPKDKSYARLSIAVCYLSKRDIDGAVPELKAVVDMPDVPADAKAQAKELLGQIEVYQKQQSQKKPKN